MPDALSPNAQKIQAALQAQGLTCRVVELPQSTRTAREAAEAVGCRVEQIVKTILFRGKVTGKPILVAVSGGNRVDEEKLGVLAAEPVEKADANYVRERTGYAIGGVSPLGLREAIEIYVDEDLLGYPEIWAAAGTPNAVFRLAPADLQRITGGQVISIK